MGRVLGLDFGTRRVGAALSDPRRQIASPLEVYERRSPELDARHYRELVEEARIDRIVVGLPVLASGHAGKLAVAARAFGAWLVRVTGRPVAFFDERYTSKEAEARLRESGVKAAARKRRIDMMAAQILLQDYLDAGCPADAPAAPLDDPSP